MSNVKQSQIKTRVMEKLSINLKFGNWIFQENVKM